MSNILTLRDTSVALQALDLDHRGDIIIEPRLLNNVLNYVCSHNSHIQQLGIIVAADICPIMSCVSKCQTLTSLKLSVYPRGRDNYTEFFPKSLNLPLLTSLDLTHFTFCGDKNGCAEPFSSFTKLNSLVIRNCKTKDAQILSISSETLVNLALHYYYYSLFNFAKIELSTPSLCTFTFPETLDQKIYGSGLSSVKQVNIAAPDFAVSAKRALVLLSWFQDLVSVESLIVTSTTLQVPCCGFKLYFYFFLRCIFYLFIFKFC
jgi:hypothetical protein